MIKNLRTYLLMYVCISCIVFIETAVNSQDRLNDFQLISVSNLSQIAPIVEVGNHGANVIDLAFDPSNTSILSIGTNGMLRRWDLDVGNNQVVWQGEPLTVATISINGNYMACVCASGTASIPLIRVVETESGSEITSIVFEDVIHDLTITPDGEKLGVLVGSSAFDFRVEIWDIRSGELELEYTGYRWGNEAMFGNQALLGVSYGHMVRVWNQMKNSDPLAFEQFLNVALDVGDDTTEISAGLSKEVVGFSFSSDESRLATMSNEGYIWLWNVSAEELEFMLFSENPEETTTFPETSGSSHHVNLIFHPGGEILVTNNLGQICFWDLSNKVLKNSFTLDASNLAFSSDGRLFATSDAEGQIVVWGVLAET